MGSLLVNGGGDTPESAIDGLEMARRMSFREGVQKYIILLTDADYKVANNYGITSLTEEADKLKLDGKTTCIITSTDLKSVYAELLDKTGGIFADIYGNFSTELAAIKTKILSDTSDGVWIMLSDLNVVKVKKFPSITDTITDSDEDGIPDSQELILTGSPSARVQNGVAVHASPLIIGPMYFNFKTNPAKKDSDGDGASDNEDILPLQKYANPIMLLHGRTDNTGGLFGALNDMKNAHYDMKNINKSLNDKDYTNPEDQRIISIVNGDSYNLAYFLKTMDSKGKKYEANYNLFAFNYPNEDFINKNGLKLEKYIKNLMDRAANSSDIKIKGNMFLTKADAELANENVKFDFIGHSMGGLVSRYYIENIPSGAKHSNKLITIDTPHWGSGLANAAYIIDISSLLGSKVCDVDLMPSSMAFGGEKKKATSIWAGDRADYINNNQTSVLKLSHSETKYYAVAGYDYDLVSDLYGENVGKNFMFDLNIDNRIQDFDSFERSIKDGFYTKFGKEVGADFNFNYGSHSSGDNIVNNQSQLGMEFAMFGERTKYLSIDRAAMNLNTEIKIGLFGTLLHSYNPHRLETLDKVKQFLLEN